jgi:hypothetical protein
MKHRIRRQPSEEELEQLGQLVDRLDNLRAGLNLPMPPTFHVSQMKPILEEVSAELKTIVIGLAGTNPWEGDPQ